MVPIKLSNLKKLLDDSIANQNNNYRFELQLVVIGILIPVYLSILPKIINPLSVWGTDFTFNLIKDVSYILGFCWFATLLIGTFSLIDKQTILNLKISTSKQTTFDLKKIRDKYNLSFLFVNAYTLGLGCLILGAYLGVVLLKIITSLLALVGTIIFILILIIYKLRIRHDKK